MRIGAIEAGGTKFVCGVGDESGNIFNYVTLPTSTPEQTLAAVFSFFQHEDLDALGVGCFGPIDVNISSKNLGLIMTTPKVLWRNFNILDALKEKFSCPIYIDTDVNGAAIGEALWGAGRGVRSCVYLTVGTGIGGGVLSEGQLVHGLLHPELGHMIVRRHKNDDFPGVCPYHGDCLEGLASGPAILARWGIQAADLEGKDEVWEMEGYYLAQAVSNLVLSLSPNIIILGGGVMNQARLFPIIRSHVQHLLNGYIDRPELLSEIDHYIVPPRLGNLAGLKGALGLAVSQQLTANSRLEP